MLRRRQARGVMWTAAGAMAVAASASWWNAVEDGVGPAGIIAATGFTAAAITSLVNALVAKRAATASEGDSR
jgi:hypothetical protein